MATTTNLRYHTRPYAWIEKRYPHFAAIIPGDGSITGDAQRQAGGTGQP